MTLRRLSFVLLLLAPLSFALSPGAVATRQWAPVAAASVRPGVQTLTEGSQCTANFIFSDAGHVYIGQAAHCSGAGGGQDVDGCAAQSMPVGTKVVVGGASKPGTMVYNSWLTMQARHETDPDACQYNDLALVQLDPADVGKVNPSVPFWGGPTGVTGVNSSGTPLGTQVYSYGSSSLRLGLSALSPKRGVSVGDEGGGWSHDVLTVTPGIPGDSGSAFLDSAGGALGVLSTLDIGVPGGLTNGVGDLRHELDYLHAHTPFNDVQLVPGTTPFNGGRLPVGLGLL